jgi:hypothetical protein
MKLAARARLGERRVLGETITSSADHVDAVTCVVSVQN